METSSPDTSSQKIRYRWPWVLAAFIAAAILLACLWMKGEIERTRRIRDANAPLSDVPR
jgi:hypothetical protein